jgi:Na+/H+-dicarboxylate symporter
MTKPFIILTRGIAKMGRRDKLTTLFGIGIFALILTTVYSIVLGILGYRTMNRIDFIYKKMKKGESSS